MREDIYVVGQASTTAEVCKLAAKSRLDLVLIEVAAPRLNAFDVMRNLDRDVDRTKYLLFSDPRHSELLVRAIRRGAHGYILNTSPLAELIHAIDTVCAGNRYCDSSIFTQVAESDEDFPTSGPIGTLTPRECNVMQQLVEGLSAREIGERLNISPKTVDTHRSRLMQKLGVRKITGLVHIAVREGLIAP